MVDYVGMDLIGKGNIQTIQNNGVSLNPSNTVNISGSGVTTATSGSLINVVVPGISADPIWAAAGDLVYGTGNDTAAILSKGTAGQVLTVNSGATAPVWGNPAYTNNAIINGNFVVAQRGTTFTSATAPANSDDTYLLDRWILLSDGNDIVDVSQETSIVPTGAAAAIKIDIETEDKKWGLLQIIESKDSKALIGGNVSLSFKAARGASDTNTLLRAAVLSWSSTADTVTSDVVNAWGAEGTNPTLVANWTFENTPAALAELTDAWQTYKIEGIAIDTASTTNVAVFIWSDDMTNTNAPGDLVYITDIKLELGETATTFVPRFVQQEIALCERYYEKVTSIDSSITAAAEDFVSFGAAVSTTNSIGTAHHYKVRKHSLPTVTIYPGDGSPAGSCGTYNVRLNAVAEGVITTHETTTDHYSFYVAGTGWAAGDTMMYNYFLTASAEL